MMKTTRMRMAAILVLAVLLCGAMTACQEDETIPDGMQIASNDIVDYNLYVPKDWIVDLNSGAVSAYYAQTDPSSVSVMAWNISGNDTLDTVWTSYLDNFNLVYQDFALEEEADTMLGGIAAKRHVFTAKLGEGEYKFMQVSCIRHGMLYLFTYTSTAQNYALHTEEVESILTNFSFR